MYDEESDRVGPTQTPSNFLLSHVVVESPPEALLQLHRDSNELYEPNEFQVNQVFQPHKINYLQGWGAVFQIHALLRRHGKQVTKSYVYYIYNPSSTEDGQSDKLIMG